MSILEIGFTQPLHVRTEQLSSADDACRLLYISDIHLRRRRSGMFSTQIMEAVDIADPDLILLGGDMLDHASELPQLTSLIANLAAVAPVLAVGGNHDQAVGIDEVQKAVQAGGGTWIHNQTIDHLHHSRLISISGPEAGDPSDADVRILCAHNPRIWKTSRHQGYDLVLAGHLHGCQAVAFEFRDRLFPGALFYPYNYMRHQSDGACLVVSRGVSDLVPIRWRCPREVVLCLV